MAARQVYRRLLSLLASHRPQPSIPAPGPSWKSLVSSNAVFKNYELRRGIQSLTGPIDQLKEKSEKHEDVKSECKSEADNAPTLASGDGISAAKSTVNLKMSARHDAALLFTCKVCETRSLKTFCRESYDKGVVVARCGGCDNLHLIADRLGWFGEPGSVEEFLAARGEEVKSGTPESFNLTLEDLAGKQDILSSLA